VDLRLRLGGIELFRDDRGVRVGCVVRPGQRGNEGQNEQAGDQEQALIQNEILLRERRARGSSARTMTPGEFGPQLFPLKASGMPSRPWPRPHSPQPLVRTEVTDQAFPEGPGPGTLPTAFSPGMRARDLSREGWETWPFALDVPERAPRFPPTDTADEFTTR